MKQWFIEAQHITKSFAAQQVLKDVSFTIQKGETVGLLGPNGAGKTTIIRLLNGVIRPDEGSIAVGGWNPSINGEEIRRRSGILTEGAGLYYEMSGLDNMRFFAKLYRADDPKRIQHLLEEFQLAEHQHKKVGTYSTGMKKRLGIVKALLHRPSILFLDEPTNGLDPEGIQLVMTYIKKLNKQEGTTVLLCSHILSQIEAVCEQYLFLENGTIIENGTKKELEEKYTEHITLKLETNLSIQGNTFNGYQIERIADETIRFHLPNKAEITALIQEISRQAWIHHVEIENRDLESLYFTIRRHYHE